MLQRRIVWGAMAILCAVGCGQCGEDLTESDVGWDVGDGFPDAEAREVGEAGADDVGEVDEELQNWGICENHDEVEEPVGCGQDHPFGSGSCGEDGAVVFLKDQGCQRVEECDCLQEQTCVAFDSMAQCARTCAQAGWCKEWKMPVERCPGHACATRIHACLSDRDGDPETIYDEVVDGMMIDCSGDPSDSTNHCEGFGVPATCSGDDERCCQLEESTVSEAGHIAMCALSLLEEGRFLVCPWMD